MVLGESRRENGRGAVGRAFTASPWRLGGSPRRARTGWRRVARPSEFGWTVWANQVAGRLPGWAGDARREAGGLWSAGRETGEGRERAERVERKREIKLDSKFEFFSRIPFET